MMNLTPVSSLVLLCFSMASSLAHSDLKVHIACNGEANTLWMELKPVNDIRYQITTAGINVTRADNWKLDLVCPGDGSQFTVDACHSWLDDSGSCTRNLVSGAGEQDVNIVSSDQSCDMTGTYKINLDFFREKARVEGPFKGALDCSGGNMYSAYYDIKCASNNKSIAISCTRSSTPPGFH